MRRRILSTQDFWTGIAYLGFGLLTVILARKYLMGTTARMGPGYFPTILGVILAGMGLTVLIRSFLSAEGGQVAPIKLGLLSRLLLSILAFGLLLEPCGIFIAAFVTVLVAAWAGPEFELGEGLVVALALSASSWLVFVYGLRQTMPVWPSGLAPYLGL